MFKTIFLGATSGPVTDTPQRSEAGLGTSAPSPSSPAACKTIDKLRPGSATRCRCCGAAQGGTGRRPHARPTAAYAGGFDAVQKLLTNRTSAMTARPTSGM